MNALKISIICLLVVSGVSSSLLQLFLFKSHALTRVDLFERSCRGNVSDRVKEIEQFLMVARLTQEKYQEIQELLTYLKNCPNYID